MRDPADFEGAHLTDSLNVGLGGKFATWAGTVLDREWQEGRIDGSLHIPLNHLQERMREAPRGRRVVVTCAGGYRSSIAASLLQRHGIEEVADLVGGVEAWETVRQQAVEK